MERNGRTLPETVLLSIRGRKMRKAKATAPKRVGGAEMVVASYNVHKCIGTDRKFDPERTARVIREISPDVIALQEADNRFGDRAGLLDLNRLEIETGLVPVPVTGNGKAHGWRGNVLLFKRGTVRDVHQIKLPGLEPRGALVAEIDLDENRTLRVIAAHLGLLRRSRSEQARVVLDIMSSADERPTLLLGDLNEWRLGNRSALNTLHTTFGPPLPAVPTFPSGLPVLALDRIMGNRDGMVSAVEAHDTPLSRVASDHLPLTAFVHL
ncbi:MULTISPECIES: endonuclease/exonuclease/phosphatase family protein [unclassified Mesorhizobium]|uniref:endonuclease/exonuclease/phosphatase family protein n=1 Tax=unclassified Mesorhizobium TaxID=325217 RepID=UPI000FC9F530|nr:MULTISPECIES: endonuclease/exonuclease/phosphatase family protein [unclassified Mesorhizobium]RUV94504.1 endonuclease/exonuclease/phosphatase family protein [Mesorhizobium sp. M1A.F.Ca.IN.020.04.1.1]RUW08474.1 endonuclease/exonuclease/phosphatase family protein [Mesorhizobium sp. M1A.F.Ca.IN.020.03.1.1]RWG10093.1 MAG: endonuclease/exonuclease/phosphatase family protein [Mesorhizobium sp.]RWG25533.1 MAG: endonuclease/exonuclease/phosphatase family protein [Mesorhizobium sp.]RWH08375.1 MAG: e